MKVPDEKVRAMQVQLADKGFNLAVAKANDIEQIGYYDLPEVSIMCTADKPYEWRHCFRGAEGDNGGCTHLQGDLCMLAKEETK